MEQVQSTPNNPNRKNAKPLYFLGLLGLIPFVVFFVGIALILYGALKYKDKILVLIGAACILITMLFYGALFYVGFKSEIGKKAWRHHAQLNLNTLIKDIEFYRIMHGNYPDSLPQLNEFTFPSPIYDPSQTNPKNKPVLFNYERRENQYELFSSGPDGVAYTPDDLFPTIQGDSNKTGWILVF